jgi:hypothetical protein
MSRIKKLEGTDIQSIRKWFAETVEVIGGEGWHADDDPASDPIINIRTGAELFSEEEARIVSQTMKRVFAAAQDWPDPDFVYDLAMKGSFDVEKFYPGFVLDVSGPAGRLNFVSIPGREFPNLLVEEAGLYAIVEFPQKTGRASEHTHFTMWQVDRLPAGYEKNPASIEVDEQDPIEFSDFSDVEDLLAQRARQNAY